MKYTIAIFLILLTGCYKDPLFNNEDFIVGKWKLVEIVGIQWPPSSNIPIYNEIPFEFTFVADKPGIWTEFVDGKKVDRRRLFSNSFSYIDSTKTSGEFFFQFREFQLRPFQSTTGELFKFEVNETQDTLRSNNYPPEVIFQGYKSSLNSASLITFTFVKIE